MRSDLNYSDVKTNFIS